MEQSGEVHPNSIVFRAQRVRCRGVWSSRWWYHLVYGLNHLVPVHTYLSLVAYGMIPDSNPQSVFGRGGNELLWESVQDHAPVTAEVADQVSTVVLVRATRSLAGMSSLQATCGCLVLSCLKGATLSCFSSDVRPSITEICSMGHGEFPICPGAANGFQRKLLPSVIYKETLASVEAVPPPPPPSQPSPLSLSPESRRLRRWLSSCATLPGLMVANPTATYRLVAACKRGWVISAAVGVAGVRPLQQLQGKMRFIGNGSCFSSTCENRARRARRAFGCS